MSVLTQNYLSTYAQYVWNYRFRFISRKCSEPETNISTICWSTTIPLLLLYVTPNNSPISTDSFLALKSPLASPSWLPNTCLPWPTSGSGISRLQWLPGAVCTVVWPTLTTIVLSEEPLWETILKWPCTSSIDHEHNKIIVIDNKYAVTNIIMSQSELVNYNVGFDSR